LIELPDNEGQVYVCPPGLPFIDEGILYEWEVNLIGLPALVTVELMGIIKSNLTDAFPVTFNAYLGSITPRNTIGGTLRATLSTASASEIRANNIGAAFVNPGGHCLLQVTGKILDNLHHAYIRGVGLVIR
jgi:hypothetical protein